MSNNNPEELYLQKKRVKEESKFLSKDIKRLKNNIKQKIKEKSKGNHYRHISSADRQCNDET